MQRTDRIGTTTRWSVGLLAGAALAVSGGCGGGEEEAQSETPNPTTPPIVQDPEPETDEPGSPDQPIDLEDLGTIVDVPDTPEIETPELSPDDAFRELEGAIAALPQVSFAEVYFDLGNDQVERAETINASEEADDSLYVLVGLEPIALPGWEPQALQMIRDAFPSAPNVRMDIDGEEIDEGEDAAIEADVPIDLP